MRISAGGTDQQTAERKERPAVASGGGPGGHERADEEAEGSCGPGSSQSAFLMLDLLGYFVCLFFLQIKMTTCVLL